MSNIHHRRIDSNNLLNDLEYLGGICLVCSPIMALHGNHQYCFTLFVADGDISVTLGEQKMGLIQMSPKHGNHWQCITITINRIPVNIKACGPQNFTGDFTILSLPEGRGGRVCRVMKLIIQNSVCRVIKLINQNSLLIYK